MSANYGVNIFFPIWLICSRIPDAWSIKLTFSLTITFYLIKTESRAKKVLFFPKNADFPQKCEKDCHQQK